MKNKIHIVASGLLALMLLSIMPVTYLHDLFASHTDVTVCNDADIKGPCIHKQGYSCQHSDLVVPVAYVGSDAVTGIKINFEPVTVLNFPTPLILLFQTSTSGRDPPEHV